jgi:multicomponent K+:H+ antiporter subunit D
VPLQFWLPGTYANAPGVVAALFAVMTKVGAYAVLRFGTLVFPESLALTSGLVGDLLLPAALVTLGVGAVGVLGARSLPRQVAFAGIASMGTLFAGMAAFTPQSTAATIYYILHSTFATALMFVVADLITTRRAHVRLAEVTAPLAQGGVLAVLFLVGAVAMAGMPPLSGFLGKLLVMEAQREAAALVWPVILIASLITILGFARAGSMLFWKPHEGKTSTAPYTPEPLAFAAAFGLVAVLIALTVFAGPITAWAEATAATLHDPAAYIAANRLYEAP